VIVKGNGQIYTDTTPVVAFDDYNDAELIMGYSALVDKKAAVQNRYAQWATEHRDLLEELRVVTVNDDEGTVFTNQTLLTQLLVGYAVQSAQRLERIEEENCLLRNRIQQLEA